MDCLALSYQKRGIVNLEYPKISPAPNWTSIFTVHEHLRPPGYDETVLEILENPYVKPKDKTAEKAADKKKKKKLGRGQKA